MFWDTHSLRRDTGTIKKSSYIYTSIQGALGVQVTVLYRKAMTQNAPHSSVPLYWGESQQKSQEQLPGVGIQYKKKTKPSYRRGVSLQQALQWELTVKQGDSEGGRRAQTHCWLGKLRQCLKKIKSRVPPSQMKRKELRQGLTFFLQEKNGNIWLKMT